MIRPIHAALGAAVWFGAPVVASDTVYEPGADPAVGFNLISWWNFGSSGEAIWTDAIQGMYDRGVREVSISPVRFYTPSSGSIATSAMQGPELAHIEAAVALATSLGMRVTLNPFVEPVNFTTWRGTYTPALGTNPSTGQPDAYYGPSGQFFDDYRAYMLEVAAIGETYGVDAMTVGTELRALVRDSRYNAQWIDTIDAIDAAYSGELGYAANWDNYADSNLRQTIWEHPAIDFVGIDAYFRNITSQSESNASGAYPNASFIGDVEAGWDALLDGSILPFAASLHGGAGLPVVFTEIGYLPVNGTTVDPQNGIGGGTDSDESAMAFEGFLRACDGRLGQITAAHVWQWQMPGNEGSDWVMRPDGTASKPGNIPAAQVLVGYASAPACAADMNGDGVLNNTDINLFVQAFLAGCETTPGETGPATVTLTQAQLLSMSTITGSILSATAEGDGVRFELRLQDQSGFTSLNLAEAIFPGANYASYERLAVELTLLSAGPDVTRMVAKDGPSYTYNAGPNFSVGVGTPVVIELDIDDIANEGDVREVNIDFFGPDGPFLPDLDFDVLVTPASSGMTEPTTDCGVADMNGDDVLNNTDINLFVQRFLAGCP